MEDRFSLERFVSAQAGVIGGVRSELKRGSKTGHWMWFIFPQLQGLGKSSMAVQYAISSLAEAQAYWRHPVLGPRLKECTELVNSVEGRSALDIFGDIDAVKFRSCLTLFAEAVEDTDVFTLALRRYFEGEPDAMTLRLLAGRSA